MNENKARVKPSPAATEKPKAVRGRVLVVEDEGDLRELLGFNLTREGYAVETVESGELALRRVQDGPFDLVLLDLMLPGMDGLELCRAMKADKATANTPVIMLTAKGEESDIVIGLELGADDYITKPFNLRVLMARLKAVLRRPSAETADDGSTDRPVIVGRLRVDLGRHEARVDGQPVDLTATEFRLLLLLARRPGRVFTRQQIIDGLHEGYAAVTDRSVDVQIVNLRRKLGPASGMLQTVRGVGYRLSEEERGDE